jgi:predicted Ser/Thr protein kinase
LLYAPERRTVVATLMDELREAPGVIERRMFSQVDDLLPVISFGTKKDSESERKHSEFVARMAARATRSARSAV